MAEYIEREALQKRLEMHQATNPATIGKKQFQEGYYLGLSEAEIMIAQAPKADVAEVRHGEWIPSESDFDDDDTLFDVEEWCDWQCSVCREDICYKDPMERSWLPKFCPNCGAKMDGGADNA